MHVSKVIEHDLAWQMATAIISPPLSFCLPGWHSGTA
jgi:hypothetical protein